VLRPWRTSDAAALGAVLADNHAFLAAWIPPHIASPATSPELEARIAGFLRAIDDAREWRYAMIAAGSGELLGEISLFPRDGAKRVPLSHADRVEIGYWIRQDRTGTGLVTEAVRALMNNLPDAPPYALVEIRCDARNAPSIGVPKRLGFALRESVEAPALRAEDQPAALQVWTRTRSVAGHPTRRTDTAHHTPN
jgi:RimJ/RimL family protein N-acetyltransferase